MGQKFSAMIPLACINIFQVLGLAIFCNPQLELDEQEKRVFTQTVFEHWTKDCDKMEVWLSQKFTVLEH